MIIARGARSIQRGGPTRDQMMEFARGSIDQYGEPFDFIELRWIVNSNHRCTDNMKTRGFEDTIISSEGGQYKVRYRRPGSAVWSQKTRGGPYTSYVARTEYNLKKLATCYHDRLWSIVDRGHDAEVAAIAEGYWEAMSDEAREFHKKRISAMHTRHNDPEFATAKIPERTTRHDLQQELAAVNRAKLDAEKARKEADAALEQLNKKRAEARKGVVEEEVTIESLEKLNNFQLKSKARSLGIATENGDKNDELRSRIIRHLGITTETEVTE